MIGCLTQLKVAEVCRITNIIASLHGANKQTNKEFSLFLTVSSTGMWRSPFFWRFPPGCIRTSESITGRGSGARLHFWVDSHGTQVHLPLCELLTCCQRNEEVGATNDGEDTGIRKFPTILQRCRKSAMFRVTGEIILLFFSLLLQLRSQQCNRDWIMSQFSDKLNTQLHKSCMHLETLHRIELANESLLNGHGLMSDK